MPAMALEALAPAKVNLFLHVGPRGADGYHPIRSLVTFADIGDRLTLAPATEFDLVIDGEFADGLSAGADNLVSQGARGPAGCREAAMLGLSPDPHQEPAPGLGARRAAPAMRRRRCG